MRVEQVGEGLRRFGISSQSSSLLLVRIGRARNAAEREDLEQQMASLTGGKLVSLDLLEASADMPALKKVRRTQRLPQVYAGSQRPVGFADAYATGLPAIQIFKLGAEAQLDAGLIPTYTALNKTVGIF